MNILSVRNMGIKNMWRFAAASVLLASSLATADDIAAQQEALNNSLDSLDNAQAGFTITGEAEAKWQQSTLSGDIVYPALAEDGVTPIVGVSESVAEKSASVENQAFTAMDLWMIARPSYDSRLKVGIRLHQDWQKSYAEGPNPYLIHWFSYEGEITSDLSFYLGDLYLDGYSPLVSYTHIAKPLQEAKIFADKRAAVMAERNLDADDANRRLVQGLNAVYNHESEGLFERISAQADIGRLRNIAKKSDQIWYDFDEADRYTYGGGFGIELLGMTLEAAHRSVVDRVKSSHNFITYHATDAIDYYIREFETNRVNQVAFSYNIGHTLKADFSAGINADFAVSNYREDWDVLREEYVPTIRGESSMGYDAEGNTEWDYYYHEYLLEEQSYRKETVQDIAGQALRAGVYMKLPRKNVNLDLKVDYLNNDKNFQSDMAQSPGWKAQQVLNTDSYGLANFSTTFESMYNSLYRVEALTAANSLQDPAFNYEALYNNVEREHFFRNAYNNVIYTRSEREDMQGAAPFWGDGLDLAMSYGPATPNRNGFDLSVNSAFWNNTLEGNVKITTVKEIENEELERFGFADQLVTYSDIAAGGALHIAPMLGLQMPLTLRGSYQIEEKTTEVNMAYKMDRLVAGADIGLGLKGLELLAGYQLLNGNADYALYTHKEELLALGLKYQLAKGSYVTGEWGYLKSHTAVGDVSFDANRDLASVELKVAF
jgi:hypothetical protein